MTLEAWVDPATVSSAWRDVIEKGNDDYFLMGTTTQSSAAGGGGIIGGSYGQVFTSSALPTSTWSHLALTYDGSTERLYLNGAMVDSVAHTGTITSSTNALTLGSDPFYGQFFNGLIDEVRIYNKALTAAQIQSDMNTAIGDVPSTPTNLTATAASTTQVNLSWSASTDSAGVTGYRVERCQGAGCTNFTQIAAPTRNYVLRHRPDARDDVRLSRPGDRLARNPGTVLGHCDRLHRSPSEPAACGSYPGADTAVHRHHPRRPGRRR